MDTITHTLTGIVMSRAGLKRWSPYATPILLLAANAPDIDMVTLLAGPTNCLHYHRGIMHSFFAMPLLALLAVLLVRSFARKPFNWKGAYGVAVLGVLSHLLLDWMNSFGIRLLLPFSSKWLSLDLFNIADLWIWIVLLLAILIPSFTSLVNREIGAKTGSGRAIAIAALCFVVLYGFGRFLMHERSIMILDSRLYGGTAPLRVAAFPNGVNPFRWRGLAETSRFYQIEDVEALGEFDPAAGRVYYKPEANAAETTAAGAARRTEPFRVFLDFSKYPMWSFAPESQLDNALRVNVGDLRFGDPPTTKFVVSAIVEPGGRVVQSAFRYGSRNRK